MRQFFLSIVFSLLIILPTFADNVFIECKAAPSQNQVKITWTTRSEENVSQFLILRSNNDKNYIEVSRIAPKGAGNSYEYIDRNVMFKDFSILFYKVQAVDKNNKVIEEMSLIVHPSISDIYRTWGAIKAMFR